MAKIEFTYKGKTVKVDTYTKDWTLDEITSGIVRTLTPEQHEEITDLIPQEIEKYNKKEEEAKKQREEEQKKEAERLVKEFSEKLTGKIPGDFEIKVCQENDFYITKDKVDAGIRYSDRVFSDRDYYGHKTDRPWVVRFNYRDRRFATIEQAINNAVKNIEEKLAQREANKKREEEKNKNNQQQIEEMKNHEIKLTINKKFHRDAYSHRGYEYEEAEASKGILTGILTGKNKIGRVRIIGEVTPEQFSKIADILNTEMSELNYK